MANCFPDQIAGMYGLDHVRLKEASENINYCPYDESCNERQSKRRCKNFSGCKEYNTRRVRKAAAIVVREKGLTKKL